MEPESAANDSEIRSHRGEPMKSRKLKIVAVLLLTGPLVFMLSWALSWMLSWAMDWMPGLAGWIVLLSPFVAMAIAGVLLAVLKKISWKNLGFGLLAAPFVYLASVAIWMSLYAFLLIAGAPAVGAFASLFAD